MEAGHVADRTRRTPSNATLMAGALAYEFFTPPDPSFSIARFDFDRDPARMEAFSAVYDTYRDATLAELQEARRQAADLPRDSRSDLFGARVDRLLPASHPQQRRA